jgi:hypothetical protein
LHYCNTHRCKCCAAQMLHCSGCTTAIVQIFQTANQCRNSASPQSSLLHRTPRCISNIMLVRSRIKQPGGHECTPAPAMGQGAAAAARPLSGSTCYGFYHASVHSNHAFAALHALGGVLVQQHWEQEHSRLLCGWLGYPWLLQRSVGSSYLGRSCSCC